MSGIRLHHPTAKSGVFTFEHNKRPIQTWSDALKRHVPTPMFCPSCQRFHKVKTYHIAVDSEGFALVSIEVWAMMKQNGTAGFQLANEVAAPPPQILTVGAGAVAAARTPKEITSG